MTNKLKYRMDYNASILSEVLESRGWEKVEEQDKNWSLYWCDVHNLRSILDGRRLDLWQKLPHFRNHYELTRKNLLARNLKRLRRALQRHGGPSEKCECMPLTFELPGEYLMFVEKYRELPGATWIVKPASGCQGRGIFLFQKLRDLSEWKAKNIKANNSANSGTAATSGLFVPGSGNNGADADPGLETYVVQRYIEQPYLVAGRKFDLRLYVLVTSFYPLKVWLARDGFARLSGMPFSLHSLHDHRIHLTNMSIQLKEKEIRTEPPSPDGKKDLSSESGQPLSASYTATARVKGCKWPLRRLREFLLAQHGVERVEAMMQHIARVVLTSLEAVRGVICQDRRCFELYGYDILLDENITPWLLEVNASPSMGATDPEDYLLKKALLTDVMNVLDYEEKLTGRERRVGGLDLLWDEEGAVPSPCPGSSHCNRTIHPLHATTLQAYVNIPSHYSASSRLNVHLGCVNDREDQLDELELGF